MGIFAKIEIAPHMSSIDLDLTRSPAEISHFLFALAWPIELGSLRAKSVAMPRACLVRTLRVYGKSFFLRSWAEPLNLTNRSSISRRNRVEDELRLSLYTASTRRRLLHERIRRKQLLPDDPCASTSISGCTLFTSSWVVTPSWNFQLIVLR